MRLLKTEKIEPGFVEAKVKKEQVRIPIEDVVLFRASEKYVTAYGGGKEVLLGVPLKHLADFYGDRFVFAHRNVLVSRARIAGEGRGRICEPVLHVRGFPEPVPMSRRCVPAVRRVLQAACEAARDAVGESLAREV